MKKNYMGRGLRSLCLWGLPCPVLLILAIYTVRATANSDRQAHRSRFSIHKTNSVLGEVLHEIESVSGYTFFYSNRDIDPAARVTVSVENARIEEVLTAMLAGTGYTYTILRNQILLHKRQEDAAAVYPVRGLVTDERGEPLVGAAVAVAGSGTGTTTGPDGKFSMSVPDNTVLNISYIGYLSGSTVSTRTRSQYHIVLQEKVDILDDIIVVGYGMTTVRRTAGAVGSIRTDRTYELPYRSTTASMQGRIAGVLVKENSGEPGAADQQISIRGGGTPLFVIDGVIRDARDFNAVPASDIESINILKDASATAVYGAQAGNGIVFLKTKRGKPGSSHIAYSGGYDWSTPTNLPRRLNAYDYASAVNRAARYDGVVLPYDDTALQQIKTGSDPYVYADNDWYREATLKFAPSLRHYISMSGVTPSQLDYYMSVGYTGQSSLYRQSHNNAYKRYNARVNISNTMRNIGLEVGMNVDMSYEKQTPNPRGQALIWRNLLGYNKAITPIYNPDGTYTADSVHPIAWLDPDSGYDINRWNILNGQLYAEWSLPWVEGLKARAMVNSRYYTYNRKFFISSADQYSSGGEKRVSSDARLRMGNNWQRDNQLEFSLRYGRTFGPHTVDVNSVFNYSEYTGEDFWGDRYGFVSTDLDELGAGNASAQTNNGYGFDGARIGYVARLQYDYGSRYYFEGNFRHDGTDNFASASRWGLFPSVAVSWVVTAENFMKGLQARNIVNFLKIRTSYGQVGLEDGVARLGYRPVYNYNSYALVVDGQYEGGFTEGGLVSGELGWYRRNIFDAGIDLTTLGNRLGFTVDYFYYKTRGTILSPGNSYSTTLGTALPQVKSKSEHHRAGVEFTLSYREDKTRFRYDMSFNLTRYEELWRVNEQESQSALLNPRIRSTNNTSFYGLGYLSTGIYANIRDILDSPRYTSATELKPGDLGYMDVNGDGKIDSEDMVRIGKPFFPRLEFGFNFNLSYAGFFIYGLVNGSGRRNVLIDGLMNGSNSRMMNYYYQADFWTPENASGSYPRMSTTSDVNGGNNELRSDFWLKNAAYIRLKSLQIGYDFKHKVLARSRAVSSLTVSVMGTNLMVGSAVNRYFDPDGLRGDGEYYPLQRTYSIGINIGF